MAPQQNGNTDAANNPIADLGVPAIPVGQAPAAANPLASLGTPAVPVAAPPPPPPANDSADDGVVSHAIEGVKQFVSPIWGAVKPAETPTEAAIHNVGGPGALIAYRTAKGVVDSVDHVIKSAPETFKGAVDQMNQAVDEFHKGRYGAAASDAAGAIVNANPVQPPAVNDIKELVQGAKNGNITTPIVRQGLTGAAALIGGEATEPAAAAAEEAPSAFRRMIVNPFRRAIATPTDAGEAAETAAGTAGVKSALNTSNLAEAIPVEAPYSQAKSLYQTVDKAAGTDLKTMYDKLANAQDRVMQTVDGSAEEAKALSDVKAQEDAIAQVKARAQAANPKLNINDTLAQADKKFTEAQANKEFNYKFRDALNGDIRPGAQPTVDVDKAISVAKKMTQPTVKYPTPRLFQTTVGENGANKLLDNLYAAKKAGEKAVELRTVRNWLGGTAIAAGTAAYELTKH